MKNKCTAWIAIIVAVIGFSFVACDGGGSGDGGGGSNQTIPITMVQISVVTFTMGSPPEEQGRYSDETHHEVTLTKGFSMSKYPVTQAQYEAVMGTNPSSSKTPFAPETSTANRPVEQVRWYDAIVFCNKLSKLDDFSPAYEMQTAADTSVWNADPGTWGMVPTSSDTRWNAVRMVTDSDGYRLPTEAQWEYACRAGTTTAFNNGNNDYTNMTSFGEVAWYIGNSGSRTHGVGEKAANDWGLYDMHGNVYEWCWDLYNENYGSGAGVAVTDPMGASSGVSRVLRGGSWIGGGRDLRSAFRYYNAPNYRYINTGFRIIRP